MREMKKILSIIIVALLAIGIVSMVIKIKLPSDSGNGSASEKPDESIEEPIETDYYTVTFDVGEYGVGGVITQKVKKGEKPELFTPECKYKTDFATDIDWDRSHYNLDENELIPIPLFSVLDDYEFKGWYYGEEKITTDNCPVFDSDVTLIARWESLWTRNY